MRKAEVTIGKEKLSCNQQIAMGTRRPRKMWKRTVEEKVLAVGKTI